MLKKQIEYVIVVSIAFLICVSAYGQMRSYEIYEPNIVRGFVLNSQESFLKYNHMSSIIRFKGKFYCFWGGNTVQYEGKEGQKLYLATSDDGMNWSSPVEWTPDNGLKEWQPCALNYNDQEIMVFWQNTGPPFWFSTLDDHNGTWQHTQILDRTQMPDGNYYHAAATQNPLMLPSGRICQTVTWVLEGGGPGSSRFSAVLYTDDAGQSFDMEVSSFVYDPLDGTKSFESMLVEQYDGNVRMFVRNQDRTYDPDQMLMTSLGDSNAENFFSPAEFSGIRTISSRCWVASWEDRKIMLLNDSANGTPALAGEDRKNIAMFLSRSGKDDFAAGIPVVEYEPEISYPQGYFYDNKLYFTYSYNNSRNIRYGIVDPLPDPNAYYLLPRGEDRLLTDHDPAETEKRVEKVIVNGHETLKFYGNGSAGVDVDILEPATDTLKVKLPVFVTSVGDANSLKLMAVGDGQIEVIYKNSTPDRYYLNIDDTLYDAGPFERGIWNDIVVVINSSGIYTHNLGESVAHPPASGFNGRLYLGDGYPDEFLDEQYIFHVLVDKFGTEVIPNSSGNVCGDINNLFPYADINYDCIVDINDFAKFTENWLNDTYTP